jgi:putative PIN family toxin of toxin-antitoxin system
VRVVLDANVLFSAFATRGVCAEVLDRTVARFEPVTSGRIVGDATRALRRKAGATAAEREAVEAVLTVVAIWIDPPPLAERVSRDPDDDHVLAVAVATGASYLVTGDRDLLVLRRFRGVEIVAPAAFLRALEAGSDLE